MTKTFVHFVGFTALLAVLGCGGPKGSGPGETSTVTGKVTLSGGRPLTGGMITFAPAAGSGSVGTGQIKGDGTYEALNVPRGECKVAIDNLQLRGAIPVGAGEVPGMASTAGQKYVPIDNKYTKADTSGLKTNVTGKTHTADFELK